MSGTQNTIIISILCTTGILLFLPPSYAQDGQSPLELLVAGLANQLNTLNASQSDTQKIVQNNTDRIAALENTVDFLLNPPDQSPPAWTVTPPDSHEYAIKHAGKSWGICIDAADPDGLPIAYVTITSNSKILTTSKCASGHEHRFTIPDAGQSETHTIRAIALGGSPANEHVDFTWTVSVAAAKDYSPTINITWPRNNTPFSDSGPDKRYWQYCFTIDATMHDGTKIPSKDLVLAADQPWMKFLHLESQYVKCKAEQWLYWFDPTSSVGTVTTTISYTDTVNGTKYTGSDSITFHLTDN